MMPGLWGDQPINWGAPSRPLAWLHILAPQVDTGRLFTAAMQAWERRDVARVRRLLSYLTRQLIEAYRAHGIACRDKVRWRYFYLSVFVRC